MSILPKLLPWLPSAKRAIEAAGHPGLRILDGDDVHALNALIDARPIEHIFLRNQLDEGIGPHRNGGFFLGLEEDKELVAACWVGANVVPTLTTVHNGALFGTVVRNLRRNFASVFGPDQAVHGIWSTLRLGHQQAFGIRPNQPLLAISTTPKVEPAASVRPAQEHELNTVLPVSAAMFREELGFSPFIHGDNSYQERVRQLIIDQHTLIGFDDQGYLNFKADLGTVTADCAQVQGVYVPPHRRGKGVASYGMAVVAEYALQLCPNVSLYVNDFNTSARRVYEKVGFEQIGTFATILF